MYVVTVNMQMRNEEVIKVRGIKFIEWRGGAIMIIVICCTHATPCPHIHMQSMRVNCVIA